MRPNPGADPSKCTTCTGSIVSKYRITCACAIPLWDPKSGECDVCGGYMKPCKCLFPAGMIGDACRGCGLVVDGKSPPPRADIYKPPCSDSYIPLRPNNSWPPCPDNPRPPFCVCEIPLWDPSSGKCRVCGVAVKICECPVPFGSLRSKCVACKGLITICSSSGMRFPPFEPTIRPPPPRDDIDIDEQMLAYALEMSKNSLSVDQQQEEIQKYYREQLSLAGAPPECKGMDIYHEDDMNVYHEDDMFTKKVRIESAPAVYWPATEAKPFVMTARDTEKFMKRILAVNGPVTAHVARASNGLLLILATGEKEVVLYRHDTWTVLFSKFFEDIWASAICSDRVYVLTNTALEEFDLRGKCTYTNKRLWNLGGLEWVISTPNKELMTLCYGRDILTYHLPSGVEYSYDIEGLIARCPVWITNNEMYFSAYGAEYARIYKHGADFRDVEKRDHLEGDIVGVDLHRNIVCTSSCSRERASLVSCYDHDKNCETLQRAYYKYDSRACNISRSTDAPSIVTVSINRSSNIACIVNDKKQVYVVDKYGPMRPPFAVITAEFLPDSCHEIVAGGASGDICVFSVTDTWKIVTILLLGWKSDPNSYIYDFALDLLKCVFYLANLMHVRGFKGM